MPKHRSQRDIARRYVAQGLDQGIEKGIERGRLKGRAELVIRLLRVRFGALTQADQCRIAAAPLEELDAIAERLLTAQSLKEALG